MKKYRRVCAEIDLDAILDNFRMMRQQMGKTTKMIAVVKTDGYGHGAAPIAAMMEDKNYIWGFAVATAEEAFQLRRSGIKKPILILGYTFCEDYEDLALHDVRPVVFKTDMAEQLSEAAVRMGRILPVHIGLDTGMSRIGFADTDESVAAIQEIAKFPGIRIEGMFTHFAKADERDKRAAARQFERYQIFAAKLEAAGVSIPLKHVSNSAAILEMPDMNLDLVRAGISIYGIYPSDEVSRKSVPLRPAMSLHSHIVYIKEIQAGTEVSYGGTFVAKAPMRIATIPVGYGDGYPRLLSNKGEVLICGQRAKILGRICMDQFMADVTHIPQARELDEVVLLGRQGDESISVEELGRISGRFPYEFVCDIGKRVPRVYRKDGKICLIRDALQRE